MVWAEELSAIHHAHGNHERMPSMTWRLEHGCSKRSVKRCTSGKYRRQKGIMLQAVHRPSHVALYVMSSRLSFACIECLRALHKSSWQNWRRCPFGGELFDQCGFAIAFAHRHPLAIPLRVYVDDEDRLTRQALGIHISQSIANPR